MLNHCIIEGRLGQDPELREYEGENGLYSRVTFSIANDRPYGDGTDWIRCSMTGKRAEVIEKYFKKGSTIYVEGRLETYKSKDGTKTYTQIKMNNFEFPGGKKADRSPEEIPERAPEGFEPVEESFDLF